MFQIAALTKNPNKWFEKDFDEIFFIFFTVAAIQGSDQR